MVHIVTNSQGVDMFQRKEKDEISNLLEGNPLET
jgi:hypothetical protein